MIFFLPNIYKQHAYRKNLNISFSFHGAKLAIYPHTLIRKK